MERYNKIYPNLTTARTMASDFRKASGKKVSPDFIHYLADKLGYTKKRYGNEVYYSRSLYTDLWRHSEEYADYLKAKATKTSQRALNADYNPDKFIEPDRSHRFYESVMRNIMESLDELELYHGSPHDFPEFDLAYLSSGWGQQAHGYGIYLTTNPKAAKAYSQGKLIYTVEVPEGRYLKPSINGSEAMSVAKKFFKYYTTEHEYGREAYVGIENEFWEDECKYIGECRTGEDVYGTLASLIGSDKDTSEFLYRIGYKGLMINANDGSTGEKFINYVIFNAKDIKILKKEKVV